MNPFLRADDLSFRGFACRAAVQVACIVSVMTERNASPFHPSDGRRQQPAAGGSAVQTTKYKRLTHPP